MEAYSDINLWLAPVGTTLRCQRERYNLNDPYAVSMIEDTGTTVDHVPRTISAVCSTFLRRGDAMSCKVTGIRLYFSYLPQGGLEVPCRLTFSASPKEIAKLSLEKVANSSINQ